jgi:hypothetical protein
MLKLGENVTGGFTKESHMAYPELVPALRGSNASPHNVACRRLNFSTRP